LLDVERRRVWLENKKESAIADKKRILEIEEKAAPYLSHTIIFKDGYLVDQTAGEKLKQLEQDLNRYRDQAEKSYAQVREEINKKLEKKKGLFESTASYTTKREALRLELDTKREELWQQYNETYRYKHDLSQHEYNFRDYGRTIRDGFDPGKLYSDKVGEFVNSRKVTLGELVEAAKANIDTYIESCKLPEEQQALLDASKAVEDRKYAARNL